jgi:N-acetyl-gamma-glutamyl-phosphate reductase
MDKLRIGILGASGYTGAELIRLLSRHPHVEIKALSADRKAGKPLKDVFPHLGFLNLPDLVESNEINYNEIDFLFCALPHGVTQEMIDFLPDHLKIVDLSADFRLRNTDMYKYWYEEKHKAPEMQKQFKYGLPEFYRGEIKKAKYVANTGCYVAASLLPLVPLVWAKLINPDSIIIDAASGVTGAGRSLKEGNLFCEVSEGYHAYGVSHHRHMGEIDQEISRAAGKDVHPTFTPHLLPQNRGILATIYVECDEKHGAEHLHAALVKRFDRDDEPFVHVLPLGQLPQTRHVKGSNYALIGVKKDRKEHKAILVCAIDNLVKGASGMAVQNMNIMMGYPETMGLEQLPMFP